MNKFEVAQYIALGATVLSVGGCLLGGMSGSAIGGTALMIGLIAGVVSYCLAGFGSAIKMAGKIAKWGWIITPFPVDLVTFLFSFLLSVYVFLFIPIIPVRKAYKERK